VVGRVVTVVDRGEVVVVVGSTVPDEPVAFVAVVVGSVVAETPALVLGVAVDEWAVVSVAARIPIPTALADAAMATAAVIRRTRDIARSRIRIAG
jgi:hypothetical protein